MLTAVLPHLALVTGICFEMWLVSLIISSCYYWPRYSQQWVVHRNFQRWVPVTRICFEIWDMIDYFNYQQLVLWMDKAFSTAIDCFKDCSATISWEMNLSKSTIKLSVSSYPIFGEEKTRELTILITTNRVFGVLQSRFLALFFGFFRRTRSLQSSRLRKTGEVTKKGKKYCNHKNIAQSYKSFLNRIPCPVKPLTAQQELQLYLMTSLHQLLTRGL